MKKAGVALLDNKLNEERKRFSFFNGSRAKIRLQINWTDFAATWVFYCRGRLEQEPRWGWERTQ